VADQEIDRLLLEIEVEDKTQGGSKKLVEDFATAISKLQAEINKLDTSKLEAVSKALSFGGAVGGGAKGTSAVGKQSAELKQARKELAALTKAYDEYAQAGVSGDALATIREQLGIDEAQKRVDELSAKGGMGEQLQQVENVAHKQLELNSLRDVQTAQLDIINKKLQDENLSEEEQVRLKKQALSLEKALNGTGEKSLFTAIKRVAIYRAIRGALKAIVNAFKEGFGNLAQFSDEVNQKMSQLTSSFTIIKNSVAVTFLPLLNALAPTMQALAGNIANIANAISYLTAKMQGSATYLKVNADYLKKFNEQSRLLSFDTFEKLGNNTDVSGMFEETKVSEGFDTGKLAEALTILTSIAGVLTVIGGAKIISHIVDGSLKEGIKSITSGLKGGYGQIALWVAAMGLLAVGIEKVANNWNNVNVESWEKGVVIATAAMAALATAVIAVVMAVQGLKGVGAVIAMGVGLTGAILAAGTEIAKITKPKNYAFGGDYNSADLFYANENGQTELIASTNSGGGAVMNMQQLESAIYSGMVKAMASGENGESAIYLDGNKVGTFIAGNNGFRSEANRRNTGLNWR
jgi:hypothetical protein